MKSMRSIRQLLEARPGEACEARGWVRSVRAHKQVGFLTVGDGSCGRELQAVVELGQLQQEGLGTGACVRVAGVLAARPRQGDSGVELHAREVEVVGRCPQEEYPLQKKFHSVEFLREQMHLRPRTKLIGAAMRVRSTASLAIHDFFQHPDRGFFLLHTPLLTALDCEGAGEQFHVSAKRKKEGSNPEAPDFFFGDSCKDPRLSVSGQLQSEAYVCGGLSRVYTFGPTFRAENSDTTRHLAEFWMVEPEAAFMNLEDMQDLAEQCVKHVVRTVFEKNSEDIAFMEKRFQEKEKKESLIKSLQKTLDEPFLRMTFNEAEKILISRRSRTDIGSGLTIQEEKFLAEEHCNGMPVFVTDYPKQVKSFYMRLNNDEKRKSPVPLPYETVAAMDLLVPRIGELVGGSEREDRYDILSQRMKDVGLLKPGDDSLDWYLELRKYGSAPHSGFGLGLERLIQYITGIDNIREVIPVPRYPGFCKF